MKLQDTRKFMTGMTLASMSLAFNGQATDAAESKKAATSNQKETGMTVEDQGKSDADVETTTKIRRALMDRDSLSTQAKNVKIITSKGNVVLKGVVSDSEERDRILEIASSVAGNGKVRDEMVAKSR